MTGWSYQYRQVYFKETECLSSLADAVFETHNTQSFWFKTLALYWF